MSVDRLVFFVVIFCFSIGFAFAGERIYQVNRFGDVQYQKSSLVIEKDRIYEVNRFGDKLNHKQYKLEKGKIYEVNRFGDVTHNKAFEIKR